MQQTRRSTGLKHPLRKAATFETRRTTGPADSVQQTTCQTAGVAGRPRGVGWSTGGSFGGMKSDSLGVSLDSIPGLFLFRSASSVLVSLLFHPPWTLLSPFHPLSHPPRSAVSLVPLQVPFCYSFLFILCTSSPFSFPTLAPSHSPLWYLLCLSFLPLFLSTLSPLSPFHPLSLSSFRFCIRVPVAVGERESLSGLVERRFRRHDNEPRKPSHSLTPSPVPPPSLSTPFRLSYSRPPPPSIPSPARLRRFSSLTPLADHHYQPRSLLFHVFFRCVLERRIRVPPRVPVFFRTRAYARERARLLNAKATLLPAGVSRCWCSRNAAVRVLPYPFSLLATVRAHSRGRVRVTLQTAARFIHLHILLPGCCTPALRVWRGWSVHAILRHAGSNVRARGTTPACLRPAEWKYRADCISRSSFRSKIEGAEDKSRGFVAMGRGSGVDRKGCLEKVVDP